LIYNMNTHKCEYCCKEHDGSYGSGRFCSVKCARGFSTKFKRKEINEKVSKKLTGSGHSNVENICMNCGNKFIINYANRHQKYCSKKCAAIFIANTEKGKNQRRINGLKSSKSQSRRSLNEIYFSELCNKKFKNVLTNKPIFNGWDADIILPDLKLAILWNGKWHYKKITKKHSLKQVQNRDKIKIKEIKNLNYIPYIIKDMGRENKKFVEKEFKKFLKYIKNFQFESGQVNCYRHIV